MYAELKRHDGKPVVYEVDQETFDAMNADFRLQNSDASYSLLPGGSVIIDWRDYKSIEGSKDDPRIVKIDRKTY